MLRAATDHTRNTNSKFLPNAQSQDKTGNFIAVSPLHIVNENSVAKLRQKVQARHPERTKEDCYANSLQLRANICIDLPGDFREDHLSEMRIGPCLLRMTGPCRRCSLTYYNP